MTTSGRDGGDAETATSRYHAKGQADVVMTLSGRDGGDAETAATYSLRGRDGGDAETATPKGHVTSHAIQVTTIQPNVSMNIDAKPEHHTGTAETPKLIGARGTNSSTRSHDFIHVDPTLAVPLMAETPKVGMARVRRTSMNRRSSAEPYPAPRLALTSGAVEGARTAPHENDTNMRMHLSPIRHHTFKCRRRSVLLEDFQVPVLVHCQLQTAGTLRCST